MANITGGGLHNIARINSSFNYELNHLPNISEIPEEFEIIARSSLSKDELYKTFNMGMGMVICTDKPSKLSLRLTRSW